MYKLACKKISQQEWSIFLIEKNDVCLVTVSNSKYWTYRYKGNLNGIDNAVVLLYLPENAFKKDGALYAFYALTLNLILKQYLNIIANVGR